MIATKALCILWYTMSKGPYRMIGYILGLIIFWCIAGYAILEQVYLNLKWLLMLWRSSLMRF